MIFLRQPFQPRPHLVECFWFVCFVFLEHLRRAGDSDRSWKGCIDKEKLFLVLKEIIVCLNLDGAI